MPEPLDPDSQPDWLSEVLSASRPPNVVAGPGQDDCGVVRIGDEVLVVSTDFFNAHPIALELGIAELSDLGPLLVAANVADVLSTGVRPRFLTLNIMLSKDRTESEYRALILKIQKACSSWGLYVLGGDSKLGRADALAATAFGTCPSHGQLRLMNGVRAGDLLWLSGPLGDVAAATLCLARNDGPSGWREWAHNAVLQPNLPFSQNEALRRSAEAAGGTDISDGLASDSLAVARASAVQLEIDIRSLPLSSMAVAIAGHFQLKPWTLAFGTGGDFQFLATTQSADANELKRAGLTQIGRAIPGEGLFLRLDDTTRVSCPSIGHRDAKGLSFADEIELHLRELARVTGA